MDSYAWMALNACVKMTCLADRDTYDRFFTQNISPY